MNTTTASNATSRTDIGLAILRIVVGSVFAAHGAQKLFVYGLAGVTGAFEGMGVPLANIVAPAITMIEFVGGLALVLGLFTPIVGLLLGADMAGALFLVHLSSGFFLPNGIEFVLVLGSVVLLFVLTGPGAYSVDAIRARRRS
jgi:putative oxidoreductase